MSVDELEEVFTKVHHVSLVPGSSFGDARGSLGLVYHEPNLEDAIIFWGHLLAYKGLDMAINIDRTSIDSLNLTLLIDKEDDAMILVASKVKCDPHKLDLFLKGHPTDKGLFLNLKINTRSIDEVMSIDPALGVSKSLWVGKWKGKK
jgi:hypothetical protein